MKDGEHIMTYGHNNFTLVKPGCQAPLPTLKNKRAPKDSSVVVKKESGAVLKRQKMSAIVNNVLDVLDAKEISQTLNDITGKCITANESSSSSSTTLSSSSSAGACYFPPLGLSPYLYEIPVADMRKVDKRYRIPPTEENMAKKICGTLEDICFGSFRRLRQVAPGEDIRNFWLNDEVCIYIFSYVKLCFLCTTQ
jgi:hypothetical protein